MQYREKQVAMRRLLLDGRGKLNRDARVLAFELKRLCGGDITKLDREGRVDPIGTAAAASRREVWDHFVRLLNLEPYELTNLRDEEH